jgi:hypothetical protein
MEMAAADKRADDEDRHSGEKGQGALVILAYLMRKSRDCAIVDLHQTLTLLGTAKSFDGQLNT